MHFQFQQKNQRKLPILYLWLFGTGILISFLVILMLLNLENRHRKQTNLKGFRKCPFLYMDIKMIILKVLNGFGRLQFLKGQVPSPLLDLVSHIFTMSVSLRPFCLPVWVSWILIAQRKHE